MKSKKLNLYLIDSQINDILELEKLIQAHREADSHAMAEQYEGRKRRVFREIAAHLLQSDWETDNAQPLFYLHELIGRLYPQALKNPDSAAPELKAIHQFFSVPLATAA